MFFCNSGVMIRCGWSRRAGRQPQIDRSALAGFALHVLETPAHDHGEFVDEGRLERGQPVLRHADQGRRDRLMRAAFRRQRDARRRRRHHEARILVAGIVQRIETALDEGIIERADRQQPRAVDRMRQAERRQHDEQVHLGDAEFEMLALRRIIPVEGRGDLLLPEQVGILQFGKQPAAVDPGAEIGRHGDVGRCGDDARGQFGVAAREFVQHQAKALLRRHLRRRLERQLLRHLDHGCGQAAAAFLVERHVLQKCFELGLRSSSAPRTCPIRGRDGCSATRATSPSA